MDEQDQQNYFLAVFAIPLQSIWLDEGMTTGFDKPQITIHTSALLDTLTTLNEHCTSLHVINFALSNQGNVQIMSNIILAKIKNLQVLHLDNIERPLNYNKRKRDDDEPVGFLDPLINVSSHTQLKLSISAQTQPYLSLVSTYALSALFESNAGKL